MSRFKVAGGLLIAFLVLAGCGDSGQEARTVKVGPPVEVELDQSDPDAAEKVLAVRFQALKNPDDAVARGELGMAYEINGFRNAALETYDQASALDPNDPRWPYLKALLLGAIGQLPPAMEAMQRSIELDPLYVPAHLHLAQWLLDTGEAAGAEESYREVLELDPSSRAAQLGVARALIQQQQPEAAIERLQDYIAERPNDAYAHQLLGTAYRDLGDMEQASQWLARGSAEARPARWPDPRVEEKLRFIVGYGADMLNGEKLLASQQTAEAIVVFESLLERRPDDPQATNNLAVAYRRDGQVDRALTLLLDAVKRKPDYFPYYLNLTTIYHERGEFEQALKYADESIEKHPALAQAHARRGRILISMGRQAEALESYETALTYEPDNRIWVNYAGMLATELDRCERAVYWLEKGTELAPNLLPGFIALGQCKAKLGDFDGAEAALAAAERLAPNSKDLASTRDLVEELKSQGS
jgi:tetratricopeptide (TPR) repeat protein